VLENPDYAAQILEEANIKKLILIDDETKMVKVCFKPDAKKIGPRAGKHLKAIAEALEHAATRPSQIEIDGQTFDLAPDEIIVSYEGPQNLKCTSDQDTFIALDTTLTLELVQEGVARDFNRLVQDQRKALGLDISDRITVSYAAPPRIAEAIAAHQDYLRNELLAERLEPTATPNGAAKLSLAGEEIFVTITRV
jgi:isoleucyl-tRNA synthetase